MLSTDFFITKSSILYVIYTVKNTTTPQKTHLSSWLHTDPAHFPIKHTPHSSQSTAASLVAREPLWTWRLSLSLSLSFFRTSVLLRYALCSIHVRKARGGDAVTIRTFDAGCCRDRYISREESQALWSRLVAIFAVRRARGIKCRRNSPQRVCIMRAIDEKNSARDAMRCADPLLPGSLGIRIRSRNDCRCNYSLVTNDCIPRGSRKHFVPEAFGVYSGSL